MPSWHRGKESKGIPNELDKVVYAAIVAYFKQKQKFGEPKVSL